MDAKISYYEVSPASAAEIRRSFASLGPVEGERRWAAATDWKVTWKYQFDQRAIAGCSVRTASVHVDAVITLPRWAPDESVDSSAVIWWQSFSAGLLEHERGHVLIALNEARAIHEDMQHASGGACEALANALNSIGQRHLSVLQATEAAYDRSTRHGATQIDSIRATGFRRL